MIRYQPCSGQSWSKGPRQWGIWSPDLEPWWRALDSRGRVRLFASFKAAETAAKKLGGGQKRIGRLRATSKPVTLLTAHV